MEGSDAAAVQQALAGDREAFRVLVDRHGRSLFRLAYRMTGNEHDAEEVVQETFLRAYRRLAKFESRSNFGTWLYRIGINCALDFRRSLQRREHHCEKFAFHRSLRIGLPLQGTKGAREKLHRDRLDGKERASPRGEGRAVFGVG